METQQSFHTNPDCKYQPEVLLTDREKRLLRQQSILVGIPLVSVLVIGVLLFGYLLVMGRVSLTWDYVGSAFLLLVLATAVPGFFKQHKTKEVFESVLVERYKLNGRHLFFKDCIGSLGLLDHSIRMNDLKVGAKYRVHKVAGRSTVLALELVE
jgi:hypothetical protein